MEGLISAQAEKLTKILYSAQDVMAESVTQVPESSRIMRELAHFEVK